MQKLPEVPWPTVLQGRPLAFDVGFFNGRDTLEFLRAGHRVVAVEANPSSYQHGLDTFASFINAGQLRMVNALVSRDEAANGTRPFYVHHEKADWASLEESIGCRKGVNDMLTVDRSKCTQVELPLVSCRSLLRRHGLPYVLKLDIEGHEQACLRPLPELAAAAGGRLLQRLALPQYISMETGWVERHDKPPLFPWLLSLGYLRAKIVDQQAFRDWSGPYGDGALDIQTGAAWHALAGWQPAPCPHSWCDYWFALGPLARAPTRHRPLNASKVAGEAHLLDKLLLQGHLHGKWK